MSKSCQDHDHNARRTNELQLQAASLEGGSEHYPFSSAAYPRGGPGRRSPRLHWNSGSAPLTMRAHRHDFDRFLKCHRYVILIPLSPSYRAGQLVVEYATVCFRSQKDFGPSLHANQ